MSVSFLLYTDPSGSEQQLSVRAYDVNHPVFVHVCMEHIIIDFAAMKEFQNQSYLIDLIC